MLILLLKSCLVLLNTAVNNLLLIQFSDIYMYIHVCQQDSTGRLCSPCISDFFANNVESCFRLI